MSVLLTICAHLSLLCTSIEIDYISKAQRAMKDKIKTILSLREFCKYFSFLLYIKRCVLEQKFSLNIEFELKLSNFNMAVKVSLFFIITLMQCFCISSGGIFDPKYLLKKDMNSGTGAPASVIRISAPGKEVADLDYYEYTNDDDENTINSVAHDIPDNRKVGQIASRNVNNVVLSAPDISVENQPNASVPENKWDFTTFQIYSGLIVFVLAVACAGAYLYYRRSNIHKNRKDMRFQKNLKQKSQVLMRKAEKAKKFKKVLEKTANEHNEEMQELFFRTLINEQKNKMASAPPLLNNTFDDQEKKHTTVEVHKEKNNISTIPKEETVELNELKIFNNNSAIYDCAKCKSPVFKFCQCKYQTKK